LAKLTLAAQLVELPPPCFPYQSFWGLHFIRLARPFRDVGSLPMIRNAVFREWLSQSIQAMFVAKTKDSERPAESYALPPPSNPDQRPDFYSLFEVEVRKEPEKLRELEMAWMSILRPSPVPESRLRAKFFRSRAWGVVGGWLFPTVLLIDDPPRYWEQLPASFPPAPAPFPAFRKWLAGRPKR
jgi:hypothetical protein